MLGSLLVVVIIGGVVAAVTWLTIADTQPATTGPTSRSGADPPALDPALGPAPEVATPPADPLADESRIPWWRRLRALVGLGLAGAAIGAGLAALIGLTVLVTLSALDRALG